MEVSTPNLTQYSGIMPKSSKYRLIKSIKKESIAIV